MALAAIDLKNVSVGFGENTLLHNIVLQVPEGDSLVILGPSGSGKSTLLKTMAGLLTPLSGEVRVLNTNLYKVSEKDREAVTRNMGMLFQKNALFDSLTCLENVSFPLRETTKKAESEVYKISIHFLKAVGLEQAKDLLPHEISGGMQKRLGIARALALSPQIILYDDPTAGLDPITSKKIIELILQLRAELGTTLVSITNDMNRAFQLGDSLAMVIDGTVLNLGNKEQVMASKDPRVFQFVRGLLDGPLKASQ